MATGVRRGSVAGRRGALAGGATEVLVSNAVVVGKAAAWAVHVSGFNRSKASRVLKPYMISVGVLLVELYFVELFKAAVILGRTDGQKLSCSMVAM